MSAAHSVTRIMSSNVLIPCPSSFYTSQPGSLTASMSLQGRVSTLFMSDISTDNFMAISFLNLPITIISLLIYFWTIAILTSCNLFDTNCFFPYMLNKFQNDLLSLNTQFHKIVAAYHRRLINT